MMLLILIVLPLIMALAAYCCGKNERAARCMLLLGALLHLLCTVALDCMPEVLAVSKFASEWLGADILSRVVVTVASVLFFSASLSAQGWIPAAEKFESPDTMRENLFCALLLIFLSVMTLVSFARNFGLLWVAVEATTLASAPLILFHRSRGSLEAMWKYLLICSVGIGLALFGTFMLAVAVRGSDGAFTGLSFSAMAASGNIIHLEWFKAAFVFCFAGYGLKMGLAPFHTWLPDAHSEAPSLVSVLLSGALLNCSFLGIVRVLNIAPEVLKGFCSELLIGFGLFSLLIAAFFMIRQRDYKRMLAYSSVEHMGLLAIMWGLGIYYVAVVHMVMHSLCKMILFLTAGNFLLARHTREISGVKGMFARMPLNSAVWMSVILLICGMPPSPLFVTEYLLVASAGGVLGGIILVLLFAVFCAMSFAAVKMTMGASDITCGITPAEKAAEKLGIWPALLMFLPVTAGVVLSVLFAERSML